MNATTITDEEARLILQAIATHTYYNTRAENEKYEVLTNKLHPIGSGRPTEEIPKTREEQQTPSPINPNEHFGDCIARPG